MTVVKLRDKERAISRLRDDESASLLGWGAEAQYYRDVIAVLDAYEYAHARFKIVAGLRKVRMGLTGPDWMVQAQAVHRRVLQWFEELCQ